MQQLSSHSPSSQYYLAFPLTFLQPEIFLNGHLFKYRQSHKAFFTKSDLFFVCMLQPLSTEIQKQEEELEAAQVIAGSEE